MPDALFPLGWIAATPGALEAFEKSGERPEGYLRRHVTGDRGHLDEHDKLANQRALDQPDRIFSSYRLRDGTKFYIITVYDRSATTLLLPEDS